LSATRRRLGPLRILVLMHEQLVPPESVAGLTEQEISRFKTEFDVTSTLREMGHEVAPLGIANDLGPVRQALHEFRPSITFNLMEEFHGVALYDQHVVSYLELLKRRYTGCNPRGLMLAHDKALSKQVLAYHRIPVPEFLVFPLHRRFRSRPRAPYPLFVKSLTAEGSEGIAQASIVHDEAHLRERVDLIHRQVGTDAIAERYIEGRELYVGVMGHSRLTTLPVWELRFTKDPDDAPKIATSRVKWDLAYQTKHGVEWGEARELSRELTARIARICTRAYRALGLTGYARIDLRLAADGTAWVLEANPNPDVARGGELADAAQAAGMSYPDLLDRILRLGLSYRALWEA
jgi:D-alanine-D-alanine ligase